MQGEYIGGSRGAKGAITPHPFTKKGEEKGRKKEKKEGKKEKERKKESIEGDSCINLVIFLDLVSNFPGKLTKITP